MSKYEDIEFLENFIGKEWLNKEYQNIEAKAPFKEVGEQFSSYHPWVCYMYELSYLIRNAEINEQDTVALGQYHYYLSNAGALLKFNIDELHNKKDIIERLKKPDKFHDVIWELEVITMLKLLGYKTKFVIPMVGETYDIISTIYSRPIAIECKNKIIDNSIRDANNLFIHALSIKIENIDSIKQKVIQISFEQGYFEDIKKILYELRKEFSKNNKVNILGRYKIRALNKSFETSPIKLLEDDSVQRVVVLKSTLKKEVFAKNPKFEETIAKLVFKYPSPEMVLKNLNKVLNKANKQLIDGGVVFLRVPKSTFKSAIIDVKKELRLGMKNISAVKIVSNDVETMEDEGIKIWRLEELVVSEREDLTLILNETEIERLNQPMVFTKYAEAFDIE